MTRPLTPLAFVAFLTFALHAAHAQDDPHADAPRVTGTLRFTCKPDPKTGAAGATAFDDTLDIFADRVESKALKGDGFPIALAIPKVERGVTTFNATFKHKGGATAVYFVRVRADGTVSGSLTRNDPGGKTRRYTLGPVGGAKGTTPKPSKADADVALDPGVLRVNGGFVRLMSVRGAMAAAGVAADKAKLAAVLNSAGDDHNAMRVSLAKREIAAPEYVRRAEARLSQAFAALRQLAGDQWPAVEAAYDAPFAAGYVHLNRMRVALGDAGAPAEVTTRADQAVVQALVDLATLAKKREQLTPEAVGKLTSRARTDVLHAIGNRGDAPERFEQLLKGMSASEPTTRPHAP